MPQHVVLLPGMLCDEDYWAAQLSSLSAMAEVSIASYPLARSIAEMAEIVLAEAPPRFVVIGHSMGGRVALEIAARAADRLAGIGLCGTDSRGLLDEQARRREEDAARAMAVGARSTGFQSFAVNWARRIVAPSRREDAKLIGRIAAMAERFGQDGLEAHLAAGLSRRDYEDLLPTIRAPALLVAGAEDVNRPPERHRAIAERLPRAQLRVIDGCGHMMSMEDADAVTAAMRPWIASLGQ